MTRLRVQLNFEIEGNFTVLDASEWVGNELIGEGLNGLIDRGVIKGEVKLFDGVYRRVDNAAQGPARRRR
ncbi:MAG TPA: hypothetical protein VGK73_31515 [Polyangiaceae bacterium]